MPKIITDEEIFQAVIRVVTERGYVGATTKEIAKAANISEVTLFRRFDNKLGLVKQAIEATISKTDFDTAIKYTGDIISDLIRVVKAYQGSAVKYGQLIFTLLAETLRHPELTEILITPLEIFTKVSSLISRYQSEVILRQEPPLDALAALLGPLMYSSILNSVLFEDNLPPLDPERLVTRFLYGRLIGKSEN